MGQLRTRKRGSTWEWSFEGAKINGKRNPISHGGYRTNMTLLAAGLPLRTSAYLIIWIIGMIIMSKPISVTIHKRIMKRKSVCI